MTNTHSTPRSSTLKVPTGTQIYDALMSKIDTDLVSRNLPTLAATYRGESAADRAKRFKRYQKAYAAYDQAYALWIGKLHMAVEKYRRTALTRAEAEDRGTDLGILAQLESSFVLAK